MGGTVTNTTDDTLTDVNLHPLTSYSPMTTAREVEVSVESDPESFIGERIISAGNFDSVPDLAPGGTATWRIRVQQSALQISGEEGVYWIGVQALAFDSDGIREVRGRARSFIPLVRGAAEGGADLHPAAGAAIRAAHRPRAGSAAPTSGPPSSTRAGAWPTSRTSSAAPAPPRSPG